MNQLQKARGNLVINQPFFASLLLGMPMVRDDSVSTMAVDGKQVMYNDAWTSSLSFDETVFVLAHEVMHCVFQHMHYRGSKDPTRYNMAADYIINDLLVRDNIGKMPKCGLYDTALVKAGNGTTDGVYALLPDNAGKDASGNAKTPGNSNAPLDDCQDSSADPAQAAQDAAEMKVRIIQAVNAAKMQGQLSGSLERLVNDLMKPKTNWQDALRRFLSERAKTDLSYARPKRRFLADDLYLPSMTGERLGHIAVAIDCSGSIDQRTLDLFSAELNAIISDTSPSAIDLIYFDAKVTHTESVSEGDSIQLKAHGGSCTAFSPIFDHIALSTAEPRCCIVLTDLYSDDFGQCPSYPVLWASIGGTAAPFGEIIQVQVKE